MASRDLTEATRARVHALYADYVRGDMAAVMGCMAEGIAWHSLGNHDAPWSGRWLGKQGVADYFAAVGRVCAVTGWEIERVIADGEWATVLGTLRVRFHADGSETTYAKVDILHLADGMLVEFREFYDTATMLRDLGRVNTASSDRATP
ncbi:nuclear transport factor 2 family protein [Roseomonas eburnea]|uniref:Nuclear transport factor 2 family protein n=1 Tax=Neoroseomonas eburnea TaxID=1346889 RepID=A0A9X9X6B6_9PROT|nr:nuclear transport factor 2 family protein [Neoroseomonas eburnea]MBR0679252.1 nuclear transport factor 2 family protein [Neoroseomonas eburnea]